MNDKLIKKFLFYNSISKKLPLLLVASILGYFFYVLVLMYLYIDNDMKGAEKPAVIGLLIMIVSLAIIITCSTYLDRKTKKLMPDIFNSIDSRLKIVSYEGSEFRYSRKIENIVNDASILPYKMKAFISISDYFIVEGNADIYVCEFLEDFNENNKTNSYRSKHQAFGSYSGTLIVIQDKQLNFNGKALFIEKSFYEHGKSFSYYDNLVNIEPLVKIDNNKITREFHTYFTDKAIAEKLCNTYTLDSIAYLYYNFEKNLSISFAGDTVCLFFNNENFDSYANKKDELKKYVARIEGIVDLYYSLK